MIEFKNDTAEILAQVFDDINKGISKLVERKQIGVKDSLNSNRGAIIQHNSTNAYVVQLDDSSFFLDNLDGTESSVTSRSGQSEGSTFKVWTIIPRFINVVCGDPFVATIYGRDGCLTCR